MMVTNICFESSSLQIIFKRIMHSGFQNNNSHDDPLTLSPVYFCDSLLSPVKSIYCTPLVLATSSLAMGNFPECGLPDSHCRINSDQSLGEEQTAIPGIPSVHSPDDPLPSPPRTGGPIHCSMDLSSRHQN